MGISRRDLPELIIYPKRSTLDWYFCHENEQTIYFENFLNYCIDKVNYMQL